MMVGGFFSAHPGARTSFTFVKYSGQTYYKMFKIKTYIHTHIDTYTDTHIDTYT